MAPGENQIVMTDDSLNPVNREAILERVGGDESLLREITGIFLDEYPELLKRIRESVQNKDAVALEKWAHTLKGSVANFGAAEATKAAYTLESMGRQKALDGAPEALRSLEAHFQVLEPALKSLVSDGQP